MIREGNARQMGWRGDNGTDGQEECGQGTERNRLNLNFTTTTKFDYSLGVVWGSYLIH